MNLFYALVECRFHDGSGDLGSETVSAFLLARSQEEAHAIASDHRLSSGLLLSGSSAVDEARVVSCDQHDRPTGPGILIAIREADGVVLPRRRRGPRLESSITSRRTKAA